VSRAELYYPNEAHQPLYELAAIRQPHDALGFVRKFGMLRHGPDSNDEPRERFRQWEAEALRLTEIMRLYESVRLAHAGDSDRLKELRALPKVRQRLEDIPSATTTEAASDVVAGLIVAGLNGVPLMISPAYTWENSVGRLGDPGEFVVSGKPRNIVEWAYHELMRLVAESVPVATCEECARMFQLNHANRRFCSDRCGNRARQRRHAQRKAQA
jgi:hypothetical protein